MSSSMTETGGICSLPNELLHLILSRLPTDSLLLTTSISRRFHALAIRILHNRLTLAATLSDHTLILESYHPSAKLTAPKMYCTYLGTDGLEDALDYSEGEEVGRVTHLHSLYSRFQPQRKEPERLIRRPGDIPGSRTWGPDAQTHGQRSVGSGVLPSENVALEAGELFSQLCVVSHIAKMAPGRMVMQSCVELSDGVIRLRRDWLAGQGRDAYKSSGGYRGLHPAEDGSILWINTAGQNVGIKFKVRETRMRTDNPILYASEEEVAVSYSIEFQELFIRTTYLLQKFEESILLQYTNAASMTRAIVFGTIS